TFESRNLYPVVEPSYFENLIGPDSTYTGKSSLAKRDLHGNRFIFQHSPESKGRVQEVPFKYSPKLATDLLSDTLNKPVYIIKQVPPHFLPLNTMYSIPTDSLYKIML